MFRRSMKAIPMWWNEEGGKMNTSIIPMKVAFVVCQNGRKSMNSRWDC